MNNKLMVLLGTSLLIAGIAVLANQNLISQPPLLSLENEPRAPAADYLSFFAVGLGGAGFLILSMALVQWLREVKSRN